MPAYNPQELAQALAKLRSDLSQRGHTSLTALGREFRRADFNKNKKLDREGTCDPAEPDSMRPGVPALRATRCIHAVLLGCTPCVCLTHRAG